MHLFISGKPGSGKTTLIKNILEDLSQARGFYTQELREKGRRVGFMVKTLPGEESLFAHTRISGPAAVSGYGVDIAAFDRCATEELVQALGSDCRYVVIDEIGKMEMLSPAFCQTVEKLLSCRRVIATVPASAEAPLLAKIRNMNTACVLELTSDAFDQTADLCRLWLKQKNAEDLKRLDETAKKLGFSERELIENASSNMAASIESLALGRKVLAVAGRGNNGADVLSCARKLAGRGYDVKAVVVSEKDLNQEVSFQAEVLEKIVPVEIIRRRQQLSFLEKQARARDFIIDGLLGIGLKGQAAGLTETAIETLNNSAAKIVACDVPSGLSPDLGFNGGATIRAACTITFIAPKTGFFVNRGLEFCGRIILNDIGISCSLLEQVQ